MCAGDFVESRPPKPDEYIKVDHGIYSIKSDSRNLIRSFFYKSTSYNNSNCKRCDNYSFIQFIDWFASQPHPRKVFQRNIIQHFYENLLSFVSISSSFDATFHKGVDKRESRPTDGHALLLKGGPTLGFHRVILIRGQ